MLLALPFWSGKLIVADWSSRGSTKKASGASPVFLTVSVKEWIAPRVSIANGLLGRLPLTVTWLKRMAPVNGSFSSAPDTGFVHSRTRRHRPAPGGTGDR